MAFGLLRALCARLREADQKIGGLILLDVAGRVSNLFLEMSDRLGGDVIPDAPTHQVLAQMVGSSRETVSRTISALTAQGCIDRRRPRNQDPESRRARAFGGPAPAKAAYGAEGAWERKAQHSNEGVEHWRAGADQMTAGRLLLAPSARPGVSVDSLTESSALCSPTDRTDPTLPRWRLARTPEERSTLRAACDMTTACGRKSNLCCSSSPPPHGFSRRLPSTSLPPLWGSRRSSTGRTAARVLHASWSARCRRDGRGVSRARQQARARRGDQDPAAALHGRPRAWARFAREARLLATLNHPHIGAIYDTGKRADGVPRALVLEPRRRPDAGRATRSAGLLQAGGPTLGPSRDRLPKPWTRRTGRGIVHRASEAGITSPLAAANASGVPSGDVRAKVLDFGLAKTLAGGAAGATTSRSLRVRSTARRRARISGTPAYMSPEQARRSGLAVDKRTDIWPSRATRCSRGAGCA